MSLDARIESIARQVIAETGTAGVTGAGGWLKAAISELGFKLDATRARVDDLHAELHAVATRVAALEQATAAKTVSVDVAEAAPRGSRARKTTAE